MAYVLGYIAADGAITIGKRGNHYIDIQSIDYELPKTVQKAFGANHRIGVRPPNPNWQTTYRLQVGSKEMVTDLEKLGIRPKKTKRLPPLKVPTRLLHHFVRGYFDGDGHVSLCKRSGRKSGSKTLFCGFTSCSKEFLAWLKNNLADNGQLRGGSFYFSQGAYRLNYSTIDSVRLFQFMYQDGGKLALQRKYKYFKLAIQKLQKAKHGRVV